MQKMQQIKYISETTSLYNSFGYYYHFKIETQEGKLNIQPYSRGMFCIPLRLYIFLIFLHKKYSIRFREIEEKFIIHCEQNKN